MNKALIIVDVQNDYFVHGKYPQFQAEAILGPIKKSIELAKEQGQVIIFIQHESSSGFLVKGTHGAAIHNTLTPYLSVGEVVTKTHADAFLETNLLDILQKNHVTEFSLAGMMTQNCITHTAISKQAENYNVRVIADACTAPTETVHQVALRALADRVTVEKQGDYSKIT